MVDYLMPLRKEEEICNYHLHGSSNILSSYGSVVVNYRYSCCFKKLVEQLAEDIWVCVVQIMLIEEIPRKGFTSCEVVTAMWSVCHYLGSAAFFRPFGALLMFGRCFLLACTV